MKPHRGDDQPGRIGALPNLPIFLNSKDRKAVIVGDSGAADWKAELLASSGADVLRLRAAWSAEELAGAAVVVSDARPDARELADAAHAAGALVNIIDVPDLSDFRFGSIVNRSPVVVAISTDGASPVLGQSIRARIESVLPAGLSEWAKAAKQWRPRLRQRLADFGERRAFWNRFVEAVWTAPLRSPDECDFERLVDTETERAGRVTLVGAGPGDAGLLTLNAVRALQSATVVLYDNLISKDVLELARREAVRIPVGKRGHGVSCKQSHINSQIVELALAGENVVRLKGGDPLIFGRAAEEIDACRKAGVEVSVVPGISAAQGAASSLLISLTERGHARRVQFITGHAADGRLPTDIDWISVVDRNVTTVLYMPRHTLGEFVRTALRKGLDPSTPAIAIASATLPSEASVAGTVTEIEPLVSGLPSGAPVTVLVGWVCRRLVARETFPIIFSKALAS